MLPQTQARWNGFVSYTESSFIIEQSLVASWGSLCPPSPASLVSRFLFVSCFVFQDYSFYIVLGD